jgi:hypothetical protein
MRIVWALAAIALAGCGGGGNDITPPSGTMGTVSLTLTRSSASQVPVGAESAFVRVWSSSTDVVQPVEIPDPGTTSTFTLSVPAGSGYSIEVVAFHELHDGIRVALAAGEVHDLTLSPGNNAIALEVKPWTYSLSGPDTIQSGEPAAYTLTITDGPTDLFTTQVEMHSNLGLNSPDQHFDVVGDGTTASATFNVPAFATDSTLYFAFSYFLDDSRFHTHSLSFAADLPFAPKPPFQRPVKAAPAEITITFDKSKQR